MVWKFCWNAQCWAIWYLMTIPYDEYVGNKGKRVNLKTMVTRKQSTPDFPKNLLSLPPDTHASMCVSGSKNCFWKIWELCFLVTTVLRSILLPYYRRIRFYKNWRIYFCSQLNENLSQMMRNIGLELFFVFVSIKDYSRESKISPTHSYNHPNHTQVRFFRNVYEIWNLTQK